MRPKLLLIIFPVLSAIALCGVATSQSQDTNCKDKKPLQYLVSGSFVGTDTSKVNCTVNYWICDKPFSKSKIVPNAAGACDAFAKSVVSELPKETCCDCYPNCNGSGGAQPQPQGAQPQPQPQQQDCCNDVRQLRQQVKELEDRIRQLENKLNGDDITLGSGASNIHISNTTNNKGVSINSDGGITIKAGGKSVSISSSGDVSIKATGNVSIKGARVTQN